MMNIFLKQVSDDFNNYFVLMLVDQAGWHKSMELKVPENISLLSSLHIVLNSILLNTCGTICVKKNFTTKLLVRWTKSNVHYVRV